MESLIAEIIRVICALTMQHSIDESPLRIPDCVLCLQVVVEGRWSVIKEKSQKDKFDMAKDTSTHDLGGRWPLIIRRLSSSSLYCREGQMSSN
eukprot:scaffold15761_cov39-Cyclotella_meneghiniana.AAC.1